MKKIFKDFGSNFIKHRATSRNPDPEEDERSFLGKNVDAGKDVAKHMAKEAAKKAIKEAAKKALAKIAASKIAGVAALVGGKILLIVLIIIIILVPTAYAFMMFLGAFDEFNDATLKVSANVKNVFETWYKDPESAESLDDKGENYEAYLLKRFKYINKEILEKDMEDGEGNDLKNTAVSWVYGKVYNDFFKTALESSTMGVVFGGKKSSSGAPILKSLEETATEIYAPIHGSSVEDVRKETHGDNINLYDIQAFDYVAGTLFDLLDLDLGLVRSQLIEENKKEIEASKNEKELEIYRKYGVEKLDKWSSHIEKVMYKGKSSEDHLKSLKLTKRKLFYFGPKTNIHDLHLFLKYNYSYSSSESVKWLISELDKLEDDGCCEKYSDKKIMNALINSKDDYNKISNLSNELEHIYTQYIASFANTQEQVEKLNELTKALLTDRPMSSAVTKTTEKADKELSEVEVDAIKEFTDEELNAKMATLIKDLNLVRTQKAAVSYRDYLITLEPFTSIDYYTLNLEADIFKDLYEIRDYTVKFFQKHGNSKKSVEEITTANNYKSNLDKLAPKLDNVKELSGISSKFLFDASDKNPIVLAIDRNSGTNYYSGHTSLAMSGILNIVNEATTKLEYILNIFKSAENNDPEALAIIEEMYWEDMDYIANELMSNKFFKSYLGTGENSAELEAFKSDIANRTTNSLYWKSFVTAYTEGPSKSNAKYSPLTYQNDIAWGGGQKYNEFAKYMNEDKMPGAYTHIYDDYNEKLNVFVENASQISFLRSELNIKGDLGEFYSKVNQLLSKEISELNEYKNTLSGLGSSTLDNDPHGIFKDADISRVYKENVPRNLSKEYVNGKTLNVMKYKYTQEEAIKKVASDHYGDILSKFKSLGGPGSVGVPIDIGDLKLGTSTVPGGKNYDSYVNSLQWLPMVEQIVKENGDLIDPYYLLAMIATESSGNLTPHTDGKPAAGLMQIEYKHWNKEVTLPSGKKIMLDPYVLGTDARTSIEAGLWEALNVAEAFEGNLFMGIAGYNMGEFAMKRILFLTLVGEGKLEMSDWTTPGAIEDNKNGKNEKKKVLPVIKEYMASGSLSWLNYRVAYQEEAWFGPDVGTANHLEKVLAFYNTAQGMPWYRPYKGADKIYIGGKEGSGDVSMGESEDGTKNYHKNKRLVLWEQYYTDKDVFKNLDNWAINKNKEEGEGKPNDSANNKLVSKMFINAINNIDSTLESELKSVSISPQEFKSILAATLNAGTSASIKGDKDNKPYTVVGEPGFKITPREEKDVNNLVKAVALEYIELYKKIGGKDKDFALYLHASNDKELAALEIANETGTFVEFVKNKYKDNAESFTSISPELIRVAQIITGDLNTDAKDFYNIVDKVENEAGSDTVLINPIDRFYAEWLDAKYVMHEMYNAMIEETNTKRVKDGHAPYPLLPTKQEVDNNAPSEFESDIEGTVTVKGPNGEMHSFQIKKNFLTEIENKALGSVENIVIHDTGDKSTNGKASNQYNKMNSKDATETMHYVIGSQEAYHLVKDNYMANHINDSATSTGGTRPEITNANSLGVQFEANVTRNKEEVFWHTVGITKYLMEKNNITNYNNIVLHNDVTGTNDSAIMLAKEKAEWKKFKEALEKSTVTFITNTGNTSGAAYKLVESARKLLGQPYVFGAAGQIVSDELIAQLKQNPYLAVEGEYEKTPRKFFDGTYRGFDCSSFVQHVYKENGITLSRTTDTQINEGKDVFPNGANIDASKLLPGDLLFSPGHVMMWIGNGEYIHAPKPGDVVKIGKGVPSNVTRVKRIIEHTNGKFEFYSQHDGRWSNFPYSTDNLSGSGCGPTSVAMALSGLNVTPSKKIDKNGDGKMTPDELAAYSTSVGTVGAAGTSFGFYAKVGAELGIPVREIIVGTKDDSVILQELKTELKAGKSVVASYGAGHWIPYGGHLIALIGVSNDNKIIVQDPNLNNLDDTRGGRYNGPNPDAHIIGGNTGALRYFIFG